MEASSARGPKSRALSLFSAKDVPRPGWLAEDLARAFAVYVTLELDRPRCSLHRRPS